MYDGIMAETIKIAGHGGDEIAAYFARPLGPGPYPGVVVIHHMPGWDEATKEIARRFATHGYSALCPNLFYREGPDASPDDATAAARAAGGAPGERVVGDVDGSRRFLLSLVNANGKVGVIGYCSGAGSPTSAPAAFPSMPPSTATERSWSDRLRRASR